MIKKLLHTTSLKANIIANFAGNGWAALIGIVCIPIYLKYIGAEGYGLIGIFASLQVVLSLLDNGLSTTLNKELAYLSAGQGKEQKMANLVKTLGSIYWVMALSAGIIALIISPFLAKYWVKPKELSVQEITYAFMLLSASIVFQFPVGFYSGGLLGLQRHVVLNGTRILFATLKSIGAILILIFVSNSVLAFFGWTLFISVLQAFSMKYILWYYIPKAPSPPRFDKEELKMVWHFAAGMVGISLTAILLTQIDKIILSKILSLEAFGYYTVACTLGLMIYQVIGPLMQSYFPKFSNLISLGKTEELKKLYHQACQLVAVLVIPATLILVFFSKELIFIWTHNTTTVSNTGMIASIYALGTGLNCLLNLPYQLTLAYGWTKLGFYQNLFFLILMIPLTICLALRYGALGGAVAWAIINILYFLITPTLIYRRFLTTEKVYWYWQDCIKLLPVSVIVTAGLCYILPVNTFSPFYQLIILLCIGVANVIVCAILAKNLRPYLLIFLKRFSSNK